MHQQRIYLDLHVLQTVPPSCLNRDDTGSPKTALYGGATRARVSSQSWKKAIRDHFIEYYKTDNRGYRTLRVVRLISDLIAEKDPTLENTMELAKKIIELAGPKTKTEKNENEAKMQALFFISAKQAEALADIVVENPSICNSTKVTDKKLVIDALNKNLAIDIALFGRMVADEIKLNTDACAQVAHAISTHKVNNEYDYFTAVDDLSTEDNAGAGHLGTIEYNSATLYRYSTLAVHNLREQLGEDTEAAVSQFVKAFILSLPTGKQNTFAAQTVPDAVLVTIRNDRPINFVGAFEAPIKARDEGNVQLSKKSLVNHVKNVESDFLSPPVNAYTIGEGLEELGKRYSLDKMLDQLESDLAHLLK